MALVRVAPAAPAAVVLAPPAPGAVDTAALVALWLAGRRDTTRAAYTQDVAAFARWRGLLVEAAVADLLAHGAPAAATLALRYRAAILADGKAPATVARRLAGLRSLVNLARLTGAVSWALEVEAPAVTAYRDTRGPGTEGVRAMIAATERAVAAAPGGTRRHAQRDAHRDRAVVRLLADCALRRAEVLGLDVGHLDLKAGTVAVLGKGRTGRELLTLPAPTRAALAAHLATHPTPDDAAAPLFPGDGAAGRLTGRTVARIVARIGAAGAVGRRVRPHGLRHAAITEALERTGGDVRRVAKFSRHRDLRTLTVYDDNRRDLGGEVAALVAGAW